MHVVLLLGGGDLPQAYGPFATATEAGTFADTIPSVWLPSITEIEPPSTWEQN